MAATCGALKDIWPARRGRRERRRADGKGAWQRRENVEIFTSTTITAFEGFFGNYEATLDTPEGEKKIIAGGVIVAIGFSPFDPGI